MWVRIHLSRTEMEPNDKCMCVQAHECVRITHTGGGMKDTE